MRPKANVLVAVLGDVGRSPRMQYHAYSFAQCDFIGNVTLLGYTGEKCMPLVEDNENIVQLRFNPPELNGLRRFSSVLFACKLCAAPFHILLYCTLLYLFY